MSSNWNGSALRTVYTNDAGFTDSTSLARTLRFMNEIQKDICTGKFWPNLRMKLKKEIASGIQELDISPQIPSAPTIAITAGGALTADSACYVKVTFAIFDESGKEINSIESEPSVASNTVTPTGSDLTLSLSAIDTYDGLTTVRPTTIHRRIYLKQGTGDYVLAKTLEDNTTTTTTVAANSTSTIEPPELSLVEQMAGEDPVIEASGVKLALCKLDEILAYDPNLSSTGTPAYYARISPTKIFLYPRPSAATTISYWVHKHPARIFADTGRAIQLDSSLETVFSLGVAWKWDHYKRDQDWTTSYSFYEDMKEKARGEKVKIGGQAPKVKVVC